MAAPRRVIKKTGTVLCEERLCQSFYLERNSPAMLPFEQAASISSCQIVSLEKTERDSVLSANITGICKGKSLDSFATKEGTIVSLNSIMQLLYNKLREKIM